MLQIIEKHATVMSLVYYQDSPYVIKENMEVAIWLKKNTVYRNSIWSRGEVDYRFKGLCTPRMRSERFSSSAKIARPIVMT